jgi:serine/threonine-protein kinase
VTAPLEPGRVLGGRYRLEGEIARGGMGTVWEATDPLLARQVAVKTLDPALATDEALRTRFRREAVTAAAVTHPNIVATYDTGDDEGTAYIVMELVHGATLRALIDTEGRLPVAQAAQIAHQVADALSVAHARGLVHRDVKPGNVLVQPDGRVKVTDFGIAKATGGGDELTKSGMVVGTARYLAPEQVDGRTVDDRADVYSLGLVLYEMLCGKAPFAADTDIATAVARLTTPAPSVVACRPDLPPALAHVVERALARDPGDRWPSAAALRDALTPFCGEAGSFDSAITALIVETPTTTTARPVADTTRPVRVPPRPPARTRPERRAEQSRSTPTGGSSLARVVIWVVAFAVGATAGYLGYRAFDDSSPGRANAAQPKISAAALPVVGVQDYDPEGTGSRGENPESVGAVIDGNGVTVWSTEDYQQRDVGGLKSGVGVVLDLGAPKQLDSVQVDTRESGWDAEVYAADTVPATLAGWGAPVASATGLGREATLGLTAPARAQRVLLWITNLPPGGPPFRLEVAEVRVIGRA